MSQHDLISLSSLYQGVVNTDESESMSSLFFVGNGDIENRNKDDDVDKEENIYRKQNIFVTNTPNVEKNGLVETNDKAVKDTAVEALDETEKYTRDRTHINEQSKLKKSSPDLNLGEDVHRKDNIDEQFDGENESEKELEDTQAIEQTRNEATGRFVDRVEQKQDETVDEKNVNYRNEDGYLGLTDDPGSNEQHKREENIVADKNGIDGKSDEKVGRHVKNEIVTEVKSVGNGDIENRNKDDDVDKEENIYRKHKFVTNTPNAKKNGLVETNDKTVKDTAVEALDETEKFTRDRTHINEQSKLKKSSPDLNLGEDEDTLFIKESSSELDEPVCLRNQHSFEGISKETFKNMFAVDIVDGYFTKDLKEESTFHVNKEDWQQLAIKKNKRCFDKGTLSNFFMPEINKLNPFCTFMIKRHQVNRPKKRLQRTGTRLFYADLYCKFTDCTMKCKLEMYRENKMTVKFTGNLKHNIREIQARPISGTARENLREFFKHGPKPYKHYLDKFSEIPDDVKIAGNMSTIGKTKSVFQKISSKSHFMSIEDKDEITSLMMMALKMKQDTPTEKIKGFIQHVSLIPSCIMYWNENGIRLWHELAKKNIAFWDATGSVLKEREGISKYLYYELAVAHPREGESSIPITSMISSSHDTPQVKYWLGEFRRQEKLLFGHAIAISPRYIMSDRSMVFLQSALAEFNSETIDSFRSRAWRIVNGNSSAIDLSKVIPHGCLSHVMKDFKSLCSSNYKSNYEYGMYMMSLLVNFDDLRTASKTLSSIMTILLSRRLFPRALESFKYLSMRMQALPETKTDDDEFKDELLNEVLKKEDINPNRLTEEEFILRNNKNEFYLWAQAIRNRVEEEISQFEESKSNELNTRYCPEMANRIVKQYVSTFPIWSNILLGDLNRHRAICNKTTDDSEGDIKHRRTNAIMEQRFRVFKHIYLGQNQTTRLDVFSQLLADHVINVQKLAALHCLKSRKKPLKKGSQLVQEEWDKKSVPRENIKVGKYQKKTKTQFGASRFKNEGSKPIKTHSLKHPVKKSRLENKTIELPRVPPPAYRSEEMIEGHALQTFKSESRFMNVTIDFSSSPYLHDFYINVSEQSTDINILQHFMEGNLGLENLKNSCWFNAAVQLLKGSVLMRDVEDKYLTDLFFEQDLNSVFEVFHRAALAEEVTEYHLQLALGALNHRYGFRMGRQNDAHEFLSRVIFYFMEIIDTDHDLKMRETTVCTHCNKSIGQDQVYRNIQLNVANAGIQANSSIVDLMDEYFNDEEVDHVSCCIGFNKWKSVRITAFPAEIFVTIIRQNNEIEKVRKAIRVDPLINLGKYTDLNIDVIYRFKAAIIHHGRSTKSGHYVAIRRVGVYDIQIDDLHIGFNRDNSLSTDGYILLYEQIPIEKAYCPLLPNAMICLRETKAMSILVEEGMSNQTYSSRKQQILKLTEQLKVTKTQVIQSNIMYKLLDEGLKSLFLEGYDQFPNDMLCSIILYLFGTNPVTVKENFGITYVKISSCSKCQHLTKKECHDVVFDEVAIKMSEKICRMCGHEPMDINIVVTNVGQTLLFRYNVTLIDDNGIDELLASLTFILPIERLHYQPKSILSADTAVNLRVSDNGVRTTNLFIDSQQRVVEMNMDELIQKIPIEKSIVMADKRIARFRKQYKIISRDSEFSQLNEVSLE